ncbi:MAG: hypothetical protein MK066_03805 [Crocinitomicaceae bacterium]|nr:hypothetical protein [Crocinitomicaceae bacterium]
MIAALFEFFLNYYCDRKEKQWVEPQTEEVCFFNIGLLVASSFTLAACTYETRMDKEVRLYEKASVISKDDVEKPLVRNAIPAIGSEDPVSQNSQITSNTSNIADPGVVILSCNNGFTPEIERVNPIGEINKLTKDTNGLEVDYDSLSVSEL